LNAEIINFYSENKFQLGDKERHLQWLKKAIYSEGKKLGEISFIFCDDDFLSEINQKYLNHDTFTDIISFDNSIGDILHGDIFISIDRVGENAKEFEVPFAEELRRVLIHGILHLSRYKDNTEEEKQEMRKKEEEKMKMFHVEQ